MYSCREGDTCACTAMTWTYGHIGKVKHQSKNDGCDVHARVAHLLLPLNLPVALNGRQPRGAVLSVVDVVRPVHFTPTNNDAVEKRIDVKLHEAGAAHVFKEVPRIVCDCKHEGEFEYCVQAWRCGKRRTSAMHTNRTARVARIGSMCSTRIWRRK